MSSNSDEEQQKQVSYNATNGQPINQQQPQVSYDIKNIIKMSQLPPGVTEEQVRKSLAGISLEPIKGKIRSEYIPIQRMETEYKEEVQYSQVPRQVKVTGMQQKSNDNTPQSNNSPSEKQEQNGFAVNNGIKKESKTKAVSYQQVPIGNATYKQTAKTTMNAQSSIQYSANQVSHSPVTIISPSVQNTNVPQKSVFSNAIQYIQQPIQRVQGGSPVTYSQPVKYASPVAYSSPVAYQQMAYQQQQQVIVPQQVMMNYQAFSPNQHARLNNQHFVAK